MKARCGDGKIQGCLEAAALILLYGVGWILEWEQEWWGTLPGGNVLRWRLRFCSYSALF